MKSPGSPLSPLVPADAHQRQRLGVHADGSGLDIVVASENATAIEFCVFSSAEPYAYEQRWQLRRDENGLWHGYLPGYGLGTVYGFRAWGPWDPALGHVFNPAKLLLDPYARGIVGEVGDEAATCAHQVDSGMYATQPMSPSLTDSAPHTPRSVVVAANVASAPKPQTRWNKTVIYEVHVRGFTLDMPGVPADLQGTYAGLAHPATIAYLQRLGVTAVELLPIHAKHDELFLTERGLTNYWGYSTLNYFSPEPSYATAAAREAGPQAVLDEVCGMVKLLHEAGIEVIMDVVYNHTAEGSLTGRTLSWRGLDNRMYYMSDPAHPGNGWDVTGCGNSLDFGHQRVVQMTLDSLRYWAGEVGVDGFRFDLAVTLGRFGLGYTSSHPFLIAAGADPVIGSTKLIAEPWDIGPDGWQTGNFPIPFSDWNDRFRDSVRSFWLTDAAAQARGREQVGYLQDLATRLSGSADLFWSGPKPRGRGPRASINFVTAHDGFTLADLVTYDHKHNEDNLESNRDGSTNNHSWNHGWEGPASCEVDASGHTNRDSGDLHPSRTRSMRNLLATMLISAGTPMILGGDEFGRSQGGNNNAYCQDSEISWFDWHWDAWQKDFFDTARFLIELRRDHPVMRPRDFATGAIADGDTLPDLAWFDRQARVMEPDQWSRFDSRVFQMRRSGQMMGDGDLLVVINGTLSPTRVQLAPGRRGIWTRAWDSCWENPYQPQNGGDEHPQLRAEASASDQVVELEPLSMQIFFAAN